jgi:hypothetical protein
MGGRSCMRIELARLLGVGSTQGHEQARVQHGRSQRSQLPARRGQCRLPRQWQNRCREFLVHGTLPSFGPTYVSLDGASVGCEREGVGHGFSLSPFPAALMSV